MKQVTQVTNEATAKIVLDNYIKDNSESFRVDKIKTTNYELLTSQRGNLRTSLTLGRLISEGLGEFNSPEAKQFRKEMKLKISVEYFIEQAYGFTKSWAYKLVKAYELGEDIHTAYLNSGNTDKELSIAGLIAFANPKSEEEASGEANEEEANEEASEEANEETAKFGGVTLTISKAAKDDILKAIEYLQKLAK